MGPAVVVQTSLCIDHFLERGQVRSCPAPTSSRYKAAPGIASLTSKRLTNRRFRFGSSPLSQRKLRATVQQESSQEVHEYIVLFKVPCCANKSHTAGSVAGVVFNTTCLYCTSTRRCTLHAFVAGSLCLSHQGLPETLLIGAYLCR